VLQFLSCSNIRRSKTAATRAALTVCLTALQVAMFVAYQRVVEHEGLVAEVFVMLTALAATLKVFDIYKAKTRTVRDFSSLKEFLKI